jgi:hypothetical protein
MRFLRIDLSPFESDVDPFGTTCVVPIASSLCTSRDRAKEEARSMRDRCAIDARRESVPSAFSPFQSGKITP